MMNRKLSIAIWLFLTYLQMYGIAIAYLSSHPPIDIRYYKVVDIILDETGVAAPNQVVVFNMTGKYNYEGPFRYYNCYLASVIALLGNFTLYLSREPVSWFDNLTDVGLRYGNFFPSRGRKSEICAGENYIILHFETMNAFRIQVAFVKIYGAPK